MYCYKFSGLRNQQRPNREEGIAMVTLPVDDQPDARERAASHGTRSIDMRMELTDKKAPPV